MPLSHITPEHYLALLEEKTARVARQMGAFNAPKANIILSDELAFRVRAEFRVWHDGDDLNYVMFKPGEPDTPIAIDDLPIACDKIRSLMPELKDKLLHNPTLRHRLFQVEFLSTLAGDTLITLIYHRQLDDSWQRAAMELAEQLAVQIVGRARKQKLVLDRDYVVETLTVHGKSWQYRQYEQSFSQPNANVNSQMLEWAVDCARELQGDLLELYCGNGNFTLPLSQHFNEVIATEMAKSGIKAALENCETNNIDNIQFIRLSAEEVAQAMSGSRSFRRLAHLPKPLQSYQLDTVFVDPPRAGLDQETVSMVAEFKDILYISCNPDTLEKNLQTLSKTHDIKRFAMFDQFPYTHHLECGMWLSKRDVS